MTHGTLANTRLVGRKIVPCVTGLTEQNRLDRQSIEELALEQGTYSAYRAFRALEFGQPSPMRASKTSCLDAGLASAARKPATHPGKMLN
jgi:hypothetical protein